MRSYPVTSPSSAPATGRLLYEHLMRHINIAAAANHEIWYSGEELKLDKPAEFAFRGVIPPNKTLELITLMGQEIEPMLADSSSTNVTKTDLDTFMYTFKGDEDYVLVSDLSDGEKRRLGIPEKARDRDKVFNGNFKPFNQLPEFTKWSNQLAALSVPKSISSYLAGTDGRVNYSERDVLRFLDACFEDLSSPQMQHILHGNHLAWAALDFMRSNGNVEGDILTEFHGQNPTDFYVKDLGTVLPGMFFALSMLGQNPEVYFKKIDIEIWGAVEAAKYMKQFMPKDSQILQLA
ncbi:hypothetical protein HN587_01580 [Candidatus Woesearchaeota archaeon]|jgi:hypothetical protein|nr:hypothetical protein [Candidatus Woesearchaeota archaeon]